MIKQKASSHFDTNTLQLRGSDYEALREQIFYQAMWNRTHTEPILLGYGSAAMCQKNQEPNGAFAVLFGHKHKGKALLVLVTVPHEDGIQ